jgi:hypothetical protein
VEDRAVRLGSTLADVELRFQQNARDPSSRELTEDGASDDAAAHDDHTSMVGRQSTPSDATNGAIV